MDGEANVRMERIQRLLSELRYEVQRGMMERDVDETLGYQFIVPTSQSIPDGVVFCELLPILRQINHAGQSRELVLKMSGWRDIETEPEEEGFYWCYLSHAPPQSHPQQAVRYTKEHGWLTNWTPTHWQPLPSPPEDE